jgi:hypothetical protein
MSNSGHFMRNLWRWNTGAPMDGVIRADPGWFTWGTHIMHRTGKVYSWHRMPRIYRMAVRQGINLYVIIVPLCVILLGVTTGGIVAGTITLAILAGGLTLLVRRGRRYIKNTRTVTPLAAALAVKFGVAPAVAEKALHFEKGWQTRRKGLALTVDIPAHFAGVDGERPIIENLIGNRLGKSVDCTWHTATGKGGGTIAVKIVPPLPREAKFMDYLTEIAKNKPGEYVAGVLPSGAVDRQSINGIEPHIGCCFGSGYGKSSFLTSIICQLAVQDIRNHFTVIDTKMDSLEPLRGMHGVDIWADPENMGDMVKAIKSVYDVMRVRQKAQQADITLRGSWPVEALVLEEVNDFAIQLIGWYSRSGGKGACPVWRDVVGPLLWQGRAVNVHVFAVAQNFMEKFFGNMNLRPSFQPMYMSGYKPSQYRTMIGTTPIIRAQKQAGRVLVTNGSDEYWIQTIYGKQEKLVQWVEDMRSQPQEWSSNVPA